MISDAEIRVRNRGLDALTLVLHLALADTGDKKPGFTAYRIASYEEDNPATPGGPWFVLYRYAPHDGTGVSILPVPMTPEEMAPLVERWLVADPPSVPHPDIDGSVDAGAFFACRDWNYVSNQGSGSVIAIRREWAMYHK